MGKNAVGESANSGSSSGSASYEVDNFEVVYGGLRLCRNIMFKYVRTCLLAGSRSSEELDVEIKTLFQKAWPSTEEGFKASVERGAVDINPIDALDMLGINQLKSLIEKYWAEICPVDDIKSTEASRLRSSVLSWSGELTNVRNPVGHPIEEDLTLQDSLRYLDSARRLLKAFGLPESKMLDNRWSALINHQLQIDSYEGLVLDFNLPSRDAVVHSFVGRQEYLDGLWAWMADPDQKVWALVADGGKGKTTIAYEFTTQIRSALSKFGLNGFIWLTAKQRRFVEGVSVETSSADFASLDGLYGRILEAFSAEDGQTDRERRSRVLSELRDVPMLIIADDIDSLEKEDENAVQFLQSDVPATGSKVLFTSRRRPFGLTSVSEVSGMSLVEVRELVDVWRSTQGEGNRVISSKQVKEIHRLTDGCPLFVEDLLRLAKFTSLDAAVSQWSGLSGDAAREYSLKRELELLGKDARSVLEVVALANDSISLQECTAVLGNIDLEAAQAAAQELADWNLISAPKIVHEIPRFTISRNLSKLLRKLLKETDRASVIENGLKQLRGQSVGRGRVGEVTRQAIALQKAGSQEEAESTLRAGLEEAPNASEFYAMLGWLCCQWRPQPRLADADVEFERAESLGRLKSDSFFHWATAHLRAGESQATLRICKRGLESHPEEPGLWRLKGLAEVRIGGSARQSSADGAASTAFRNAADSLRKAQRHCGDSSPRSTAELSRVFKALLQLSAVSKDDAMRKEVIKEWRHVLPDDPYRPV